jgi:hypothetical protein
MVVALLVALTMFSALSGTVTKTLYVPSMTLVVRIVVERIGLLLTVLVILVPCSEDHLTIS